MFNVFNRLHLRSTMAQKSITNFFKPLNNVNNMSNGPSPKRKRDDGDEPLKKTKKELSLEEENRLKAKLASLVRENKAVSTKMGLTWFKELQNEFSKPYFKQLADFLVEQRRKFTIFPPEDKVYTWTLMCSIYDVKVVILGQDPYHGPNQAHGLCFSVQKGVDVPPSLKNMYRELAADIGNFKEPSHGDLSGWAKQGVLLLNACLTVVKGQPNSHKDKGWEKLTDAVIKWLNNNHSGLVFILWGSNAQQKGACIDGKRHLILKCPHPSPLSASRGFFGCKHFSKTNEYLAKKGKTPIDWSDLP